jgi:hypothetical protein
MATLALDQFLEQAKAWPKLGAAFGWDREAAKWDWDWEWREPAEVITLATSLRARVLPDASVHWLSSRSLCPEMATLLYHRS